MAWQTVEHCSYELANLLKMGKHGYPQSFWLIRMFLVLYEQAISSTEVFRKQFSFWGECFWGQRMAGRPPSRSGGRALCHSCSPGDETIPILVLAILMISVNGGSPRIKSILVWDFPLFLRASERRVLLIVEVCHHIFSSAHVLIFTSSHLHMFSSSHLLIFTFSLLHIFSSAHVLIFTSSHLHMFSSSHLLIFTFSLLRIFSSAHVLIFTSSLLHIFSSAHVLIFTSSHLHIFSSPHLLITSSHLHI